ncbi:response regulator [Pseudanabaena sp. FACHB-1998]|uniref:hybrid sensor histidine kinase/response regulator n=1 Tax=Pseudanabaena sp. FACHB-1998 TaxID=2692858 RepID=UPI001680CB09|nr:ATP-binding protein [Pseudanabaena sp. FACHB-1998]MBD2175993.1 response regulator [Pseudanabaena sp. FACHB-1998]
MSAIKILVVEDEVITARVISEELTSLGYIVTDMVTSDEAALASVCQNMPDLVLMDIILRGSAQDGIAIATILREEFQIPVVYITAHTDESTLTRAKISEPFGYLVKPFDERDLRVVIETSLYKHQMERKLAERENFLSTILRSTSDAVIATDSVAIVTYMNPAAESLTGWSHLEALGRNVTEVVQLIDENSGAEVANPVPAVLQTGKVAYLKDYTAVIDRYGIKKSVGDSASPIRKVADSIDGAVLVLWDISDRRKAETLESEKSEISRALNNEKELNKLKSQFIAMSSHEMRTFLTNIMLSANLLEEPNYPDDKKLNRLKRIKDAVVQMTILVENMLTLGKFALGLSNFNPTSIDLEKLCLDIVEEFKYFPTKNVPLAIDFSCDGDNQLVDIDVNLISYILRNLLSNAIKYSGEDVDIQLSLSYERGSQPKAILQIQDHGIGIPEDDLPSVFNLYHRGSNVSGIKGTGLGLAIVKHAVDIHGGEITLKSKVNQGTIFTVILPIN